MRTFQGFQTFIEELTPQFQGLRGKKVISTFDFDETLTKWGQMPDGSWRQLPNVENIREHLYPQVQRGHDVYVVTFRDPALANDPRFKIYEKIEDYIEEWGMDSTIKGVVYTKLHPKSKYILQLCQSNRLPFGTHYDDDVTNCKEIEANEELRQIAAAPQVPLAVHLPYRGPRPPKTQAGVIVPGQVFTQNVPAAV